MGDARTAWSPPGSTAWFRFARWAYTLGFFAACFIAYDAVRDAQRVLWGITAVLDSLARVGSILMASVVLHELGHLVAARWQGMHVLKFKLFFLEMVRRRRGWDYRILEKDDSGNLGSVMAVPSRRTPSIIVAYRWTLLGGPLGNLLLAATAAGLLASTEASDMRGSLIATLAVNLALGAGNLLPFADMSKASDGYQLLGLRHATEEGNAGVVQSRLIGRLLDGDTVETLPPEEIETLARLEEPVPIYAMWLRFVAARNRGDWTLAVRIADECEAALDAQPDSFRVPVSASQFMALFRTEAAMCRAFAALSSTPLSDIATTPELDWLLPYLRPRLEALRAGLDRNTDDTMRALDEAERHGENALEAGTVQAERRLREWIRALPRRPVDPDRHDAEVDARPDTPIAHSSEPMLSS